MLCCLQGERCSVGEIIVFPGSRLGGPTTNPEKATDLRMAVATTYYRMIAHLQGLMGGISDNNIALRKDLLAGLSNSELLGLVENSNSTDWDKMPSYYRALGQLIRERGIPLLPRGGDLGRGITLEELERQVGSFFGLDLDF